MTPNLTLLNCNNYHVSEHDSGDHWYAQNGLRSLWVYAKLSKQSFRMICDELLAYGETTITYAKTGQVLTLTSI